MLLASTEMERLETIEPESMQVMQEMQEVSSRSLYEAVEPESEAIAPANEIDPLAPPEPQPSPLERSQPDLVTITLYQSDSSCTKFIAEDVQVPADDAMELAVRTILQTDHEGDLPVSGYRVTHNSRGIVEIDLRPDPSASDSLNDLSRCQQFKVFDSLQETLTMNSQWQVNKVIFTERGQELDVSQIHKGEN